MSTIRDILQLYFESNGSVRAIARSVGIGRSSVSRILDRARVTNLNWPLPAEMSDDKLRELLYPITAPGAGSPHPVPNWVEVHKELVRHRSLTLRQLWREYIEANPAGYQYSRYCDLYRGWRCSQAEVVMHLTHKAGERLFVDYSGKKPCIQDPITGEVKPAELFVCALGASGYLYAEATETQTAKDFLGSVRRAFEFYQGIPRILVPDNMKAAVIQFRTDDTPILNRSLRDLTRHYKVDVVPARPRRPRDKSKAEGGVLLLQRQILGAHRNTTFLSLVDVNAIILQEVHTLNQARFQKINTSRKQLFEELDRPALRPLPKQPYEYARWVSKRKVGFNYHVQIENYHYSVPYAYVGKFVRARISEEIVEIYDDQMRIASHRRGWSAGQYTTVVAHMPREHQEYADWRPERFVNWAKKIGPHTTVLIEAIFAEAEVAEQVYRRCMGILKLASEYGHDAMEQGCEMALNLQTPYTATVRQCVQQVATQLHQPQYTPIENTNVRGATYYSSIESS
ncbi:MAG: IS21 family transposase [Gemmatimonadetes bacterium]|nr:IS21 family transposase [Gemmatimonadota bacterium]